MEKFFIGICGPIAAGKTTLANELGKIMNLPVFLEGVDENPYLAKFYKNRKAYSFPLQVYLLNKRFEQQQRLIWSKKGGVQDRTIYEDSIFAKMLYDGGDMEEEDYKTYLELFNNMSAFMKDPHLIIYLKVSAKESKERLKMRNRKIEKDVPYSYLENLCKRYDAFAKEISKKIPVLEIDYKEFKDAKEMAKKVETEWRKLMNIRKIDI